MRFDEQAFANLATERANGENAKGRGSNWPLRRGFRGITPSTASNLKLG